MCSFITPWRASFERRYHSLLLVKGYTTRYRDRSPLNNDCSCCVGLRTYCDGPILPMNESLTDSHRPSPARNKLAAVASSASTLGAIRHSSRSTPGSSPIDEYVIVRTPAMSAAVDASVNLQPSSWRSSSVRRRHAG